MSVHESEGFGSDDWARHQIAVLGELGRLADQGEKTAVLLQAHEIHFAKLEEQNKQRDDILSELIREARGLRGDLTDLQRDHREQSVGRATRTKLVGVGLAMTTWTVGTALTIYEVFFTNHPILHH